MKLILSTLIVFFTLVGWAESKVRVGYFGKITNQEFSEKVKPFFDEMASCKSCEIVNLTPYDSNQKYDENKVVEKLSQVDSQTQIIFFDWNDKTSMKLDPLINELQKIKSKQQLLVASAGVPEGNDKTCPLNQTLFGKVDDAIIVGELIQKDILWPKCHYGPEMLTAVRPPKDHMGKGYGPLYFVAKLADNYSNRKPDEWVSYLRSKKAKTRRIWPEMEEFFPR